MGDDPRAALRRALPLHLRVRAHRDRTSIHALRPWGLGLVGGAALAFASIAWPVEGMPRVVALMWVPLFTLSALRALLGQSDRGADYYWRTITLERPAEDYRFNAQTRLQIDGRPLPLHEVRIEVRRDPAARRSVHEVLLITFEERVRVAGFFLEARALDLAEALRAWLDVGPVERAVGTLAQKVAMRESARRRPWVLGALLLEIVIGTVCAMVAAFNGGSMVLAAASVSAVLAIHFAHVWLTRRRPEA